MLIRHGQTEWSDDRRHTGRTDLALNEAGERRAAALAPLLAEMPGVAGATVWTSPLRRARQTCALAGLGDRAQIVDDLAEWDYGEYEGTRTEDIRQDDPSWSIWTSDVADGETAAEVGIRADRLMARLDATTGLVVAFAHAHLLRILVARWCGLAATAGQHFTLLPATISVLGYERETRVVEHWNNVPAATITADER